jgi:hypothetical protein
VFIVYNKNSYEKKIAFIILLFCLISCSFPTYVFDNKAQTTGLNFSQGKWLLNEIDAPYNVNEKLKTLAVKDFSVNLNGRLSYIYEIEGLLLPRKIRLNPNKIDLSNLKKGTNFDFFINIKATNIKNDFGSLDITPHKLNHGGENTTEVILEIYDLNHLEIIYSQRVIASIGMPKDNSDVHLSKSNNSLIIGAYKKIINDITKKSKF